MQKRLMFALMVSSAAIAFAQEAEQVTQEVPTTIEAAISAMPEQPTAVLPEMNILPADQQPALEQPAPTVEAPPERPIVAESAAMPEPQPSVEVAPIIPEPSEEEEIEIKGIDTLNVNEPKGNWLYKRIWWEKAERLYEKIKQLADKIMESRGIFFTRRYELTHTVLDPFYFTLGVQQGELHELISFFTQKLHQDQHEGAELDEKELALRNAIMQEKKTLEKLQSDSQNVIKIEHALDDALMKLIEQLNQARYYEQQSWDNFKAINRELSDKRARELYYGMDTYWKNLNSINNYLADAYAKYFDQLTGKLQQETNTINATIQGLKEKGIDLRAQAQLMRNSSKVPVKESEEPASEESSGILGTIWHIIKAPFSLIGDIFTGIFDMVSGLFGGGSSDEEVKLLKPSQATLPESIDAEQLIEEGQE